MCGTRIFITSLLVILMFFLGGGCSSEPEESKFSDFDENYGTVNDDKNQDVDSYLDITKLIDECVKVDVRYSDYMWYFNIESTLHHKLPNKKIEFGIGHGVLDGDEKISLEDDAYGFTSQNNGTKKIYKFTNPFWFYYIFGMEPCDTESWTRCEINYASYIFLKDIGYSNMTNTEKESYNNLKESLNKYETSMKMNYRPSVQVLIGSKFYLVGRYRINS